MVLVHWTEYTLVPERFRDAALLLINNKKIGHLLKVKLGSTLAQNHLYDKFMWCYFMACSGETED